MFRGTILIVKVEKENTNLTKVSVIPQRVTPL